MCLVFASRSLDTHPGRGMLSEDFAYYTATISALYFSIGVAKDGRGMAGVHTKEFDVHPDVFAQGLRLMTTLAVIATKGANGLALTKSRTRTLAMRTRPNWHAAPARIHQSSTGS